MSLEEYQKETHKLRVKILKLLRDEKVRPEVGIGTVCTLFSLLVGKSVPIGEIEGLLEKVMADTLEVAREHETETDEKTD